MTWLILGAVGVYVLLVGVVATTCGGATLADEAFGWTEENQRDLDELERIGRL